MVEFAYAEVVRLWVREVQSAYRGGGPHSHALGELDTSMFLYIQKIPKRGLFSVVRTSRITRSGPDSLVALFDEVLVGQGLVGPVSPELEPHALVQPLGECLGETIPEGFRHDRTVVVVSLFQRAS